MSPGCRIGSSHGLRALIMAVLCALALAGSAGAQQPVLEVELSGLGTIIVEGRLTADGTLELPVLPLERLTGEGLGARDYVSLAELRQALGPRAQVMYDPRRARLVIDDPHVSLAATRALFERRRAAARARPGAYEERGPYAMITADEDGGRLFEGGWSFGRFALHAARSSDAGAWWGVSVRPFARTYLSYSDGDQRGERFGVRWAAGRTFLVASYRPASDDFRGHVATSVGPFAAFLEDDGTAAITFLGPVDVTVARTPDRYAMRLSYGRQHSPFAVPRVH